MPSRSLLLVFLVTGVGCVPMTGVPSLTLLTQDLHRDSPNLELIGSPVEESETLTWAAFFLVWGKRPTHESLIDRVLQKYDADVLVDAELYSAQLGIPYLFFQIKTAVTGQPARYRN